MLYFVMPTSFKYVVETNEVALDISIRICDTVTYTCLCCEIYYNSYLVFGENLFYGFLVGDRGVDKNPVCSFLILVDYLLVLSLDKVDSVKH